MFYCQANEKYGFINCSGTIILDFIYDDFNICKNKNVIIKAGEKYGIIDSTCKEITSCLFDSITDFNNGYANMKLNDKWGVVDSTGRLVIKCAYDNEINIRYNGKKKYFEVTLNDKNGLIDEFGEEISPCKYYEIKSFIEGLGAVQLNNKWGFINTLGKEIITCKYNYVSNFSNGIALVRNDIESYYIDDIGNEYIEKSNIEKEPVIIWINPAEDPYISTKSEISINIKFDTDIDNVEGILYNKGNELSKIKLMRLEDNSYSGKFGGLLNGQEHKVTLNVTTKNGDIFHFKRIVYY